MIKQTKAITLIALIITIIVLLILAGVTINMVLGENGLFSKAKTSIGKYENVQEKENAALAAYETEINNARETVTISQEEYDMLKNANSYSTTEKKIGTWIDGKPLYQKTILGTVPSTSISGTFVNTKYSITDLDIENVVPFNAFIKVNGEAIPLCIHSGAAGTNGYIAIWAITNKEITIYNSHANWNGAPVTFTIQYTKTTDSATI